MASVDLDRKCNPNRRLRIDHFGGTLFGIGNCNHHDRKSLFDLGPGSCRRFFGVERSFDLFRPLSRETVYRWAVPDPLACLSRPDLFVVVSSR